MPEYTEHHKSYASRGTANTALGIGIGAGILALGAMGRNNCNGNNGGFLGGLFGGGCCNNDCPPSIYEVAQRQDNINQALQKGMFDLAYAQQKADYDAFILSQQADMGLQRQIDDARYQALDGNYKLYITLNEKIEAVKDAQSITAAQLPLLMQLAVCQSERYTDHATRNVVRGTVRLGYDELVTGIPSMPDVSLKVACPAGSCPDSK